MTAPRVNLETITPETAKAWLRTNVKRNRDLHVNLLERLKEEMRQGRWVVNGETIIFDENEALVDGQHRLSAVVQTGVTIQSFVCRGVKEESFTSIDTGAARSKRDVLSIAGEKHRNELASGLRLLWDYKSSRQIGKGGKGGKGLPNTELIAFLEQNPRMRDSAAFAMGHKHLAQFMPKSLTTLMHFLFMQLDPDFTLTFFDALENGTGLQSTSAVRQLRERLIKNIRFTAKLPLNEIAAITIKAWNAERKNRAVKILKWMDGEPFPEPV